MAYKEKLICLANSVKKGSRCIAGKIVGSQRWVRPVSNDDSTEGGIPFLMTMCADKSPLRPLEIVEIQFSQHVPKKCQTENHLVDDSVAWVRHGKATWKDLMALVDPAADLWGTGTRTRHGINDAVTVEDAAKISDSLRLIKPTDFEITVSEVEVWQENRTKKEMRGSFTLGDDRYSLKVTDPYFPFSEFEVDKPRHFPEVFLCISLADEWNKKHFKLIACIITPERAG